MAKQKIFRELEDILTFGKYEGVCLKHIFQGTTHLDKALFKEFITYKIYKKYRDKDGNPVNPEIDDFFIKAMKKEGGDASELLNREFKIFTNAFVTFLYRSS